MAKHNPNRVKIHRNYTFEELAVLLGVHKNTIASWVKNGLPCLKERKPFLILGADARSYIVSQREGKKRKCTLDEMFCMRCKEPAKPAGNLVEYVPLSLTRGRVIGFCCHCEGMMNKFVAVSSLGFYIRNFDLQLSKDMEHIRDSVNPL